MKSTSHRAIYSLVYRHADELPRVLAPTAIGICVALVSFRYIRKKKLSLRNILINESYCKISDYILNLVKANMILYCSLWSCFIIVKYLVANKCTSDTDDSKSCEHLGDVLKHLQFIMFVWGNLTYFISIT